MPEATKVLILGAGFAGVHVAKELERLFHDDNNVKITLVIRWSIERMNSLVTSLFEYSKDRDTFRPAVQNIVDTVERAIRITSVRQEFRHITIKHHHKGLVVGWFDSSRLERAVANLVLNACEAVSPDLGLVVITTTGNQACFQIGVWDNGPGIPPEIRESVFQPFVSYGKAEGSGLGLAIVKKIVEDHGGEIYLDARGGTGTLFKITIPFAVPLVQSLTCLELQSTTRTWKEAWRVVFTLPKAVEFAISALALSA
jgi:signal transduction histidine kinase